MEHKGDDACLAASACRLRIVCLCQGATEAICALGLQSSLVGRSHECTSPAPVLALPCVTSSDTSLLPGLSPHCNLNYQNVLDHYNINWELLQDLKPDLIFAQSPPIRADTPLPLQAQQLTDRKCRVVSLQSHTVEDIFQNLETVANSCGVKKEGAKLVSLLRAQWKSIKQKTPQWADGMPQVNVAFLSCVNPLIGAGYWIPEIISCAGGLNLCGRAGCPRNSLTLGDLTERDPDVVVYLSYRLHVGSLATELSWLVTNREWKTLKAIKANRFFLVDANRFFINSAPNVISSTELMTEILHGFGYGHEGKGFVRWQSCVIPKDVRDGNIPLQQMVFETKMPRLVGNKGSSTNHIGVDKHEVLSSAAQDHPKYVTNVYEVKKPAILQKCDKDHRGVKAKLDVWDGGLGVVESKQDDAVDERSAVETQRCLQEAKIIRQVTPDTVLEGEKTASKDRDGTAIDLRENWRNPLTESLSFNWNKTQTAQKTVHPINSFFVHNQKEKMADSKLGQAQSFPKTTSHALPKQSPLDRFTSSVVYKQANSTQDGFRDQQLISKVWASTKSAAQMRNSSTPPTSKEKVFQKSNSLPTSRGSPESKASSTSINAINVAHVLADLPQKAASFSINKDDNKPLAEDILCLQPAKDTLYVSGGKCNRAKTTQVSTARRCEGSLCSERVPKRRSSYSVPSSPRLEAVLRKSRIIRDAVLKSLVDLQCIDCLLLSGGLASSILAEAVPLVHSKGFKLGFTVLAGPAATDRASAAVAAKCKGMEHVIIGEGEKGFAVFLLAKELTFIVETLKTFDPVQIRNLVPIAAALREAKSRGLKHVVTGDGLDELLARDGIRLNDVQAIHLGISKVLSRSAVLLGEALGIKVVQPFLHSKLLGEFKALSRTCAMGNETTEHGRATLREAFPEVSAACNEKGFNEVDSGMFYVSDYFSSAISASVLESKAKSIYQKEKICIRDAEHLVYYRAFKRVFKGKVPRGMVRWSSKPCSGCGYQLYWDMSWYCLVCGLIEPLHNNQSKQHKPEQSKVAHQKKLSNPKGGSERLPQSSNGGVSVENDAGWNGAKCGETSEMGSVSMVGNAKSDGGHGSKRFASEEKHRTTGARHGSQAGKPVATSAKGVRRLTHKANKGKKPNYWALLGAGSAGLLLLLQLSRR